MTEIRPADGVGPQDRRYPDRARGNAEQAEFDRIARRLIHERSNALGRIDHRALASAITSLGSQRERRALLMAVDAHLTPAARKRLADAIRAGEPPRLARSAPAAPALRIPLSSPPPPGLRSPLAPPASTTVVEPAPAADHDVADAAAKVRSGLGRIAESEREWAAAAIPYSPDLDGAYHTGLNKLQTTIHSNIQDIESAVRFLNPAQKKALASELSPADLQGLAFYEASLEAYQGVCDARRLVEDGNRFSMSLLACGDLYDDHFVEPVFGDLMAAADDPRTFAKLLNAYQDASQRPLSPALSVMTDMPEIGPKDPRLEHLNPFVTPDYHGRVATWGQEFINRHISEPGVLRDLVANLAPAVAQHVTYPMTTTKTGNNKLQPIQYFGDARGVIIANAIAKIKETGNTGELAAAFAYLRVSNPMQRSNLSAPAFQKVPGDVLERVAAAAAQPFRMRYLPDSSEFKDPAFFQLTEAARSALTRGAFSEDPSFPLSTDHLFIGAAPEPLLGLIDAVKDPYFLPGEGGVGTFDRAGQGAPQLRGMARARVLSASAEALVGMASTLSTKDDAVFALDVADNADVQRVVAALDGLLADHPSVTVAALRALDRPTQRGEALTKLMLMHYDKKMLNQIEEYDPSRDAVSQIPLFRKGGPLYPVALQLWHGDGAVAPAVLDQAWEDDAAGYWTQGRSHFVPSRYALVTLGRGNLGYFLGAFTGTQSLAGTVFAQAKERRDRGRRAPTNLLREAVSLINGFPAVGTLAIGAKAMLAWDMEQRSFEVLLNRDQKFHIFEGQQAAAGEQDNRQPETERIGVPSDEALRRMWIYRGFVDVLHAPIFNDGPSAPMRAYQDAVTAGREFGEKNRGLGGYQGQHRS